MAAMALGDNTVANGKSIAGSDRYFFSKSILFIGGNTLGGFKWLFGRIDHTAEAEGGGAVLARCHEQQLAVGVQFKLVGEIPD